MQRLTEMVEKVSEDVEDKLSKTSCDLADQASKTYDKMLQYMEKIKVDQKVELERVLSEL